MAENIPLQTKEERKKIFSIIGEINAIANELAEKSRLMFDGVRFLSDSELSHRLSVNKSTLANYWLKGLFGYYSLEGKILYAEHEIEAYLRQNYHPPYR
ncbi:MAG: helix-turn-helix domain-containing protein [Bacteroides sp.]|nr:helix-turn-helix domain-containing protein [Bacteroides sp.]